MKRPTILVIIPYDFYPPDFGGALRCFHLLEQYSNDSRVFLLTTQEKSSFSNGSHSFLKNVSILSSKNVKRFKSIFNFLPARYANVLNACFIQRKLCRRPNQFLVDTFKTLKTLFALEEIDLVIYENMQCFISLYEFIKRCVPHARHIYDAHNVDHLLWQAKAAIPGNGQCAAYAAEALEIEKSLYKKIDLCFCCSRRDKEEFDRLNEGRANVVVIPNGVDTVSKCFDNRIHNHGVSNILFCGTLDYEPNIEGILWFYEHVFPLVKAQLPDLVFTIVGKMQRAGLLNTLKKDASVNLVGPVESVETYYRQTSVVVVPLLKGSGTRLKILEAMSFGNAVVSTPIGAEGLEIEDGVHLLLADNKKEFADAIVKLLTDFAIYNNITNNARCLVEEKYDWNIIGKLVYDAIKQLN